MTKSHHPTTRAHWLMLLFFLSFLALSSNELVRGQTVINDPNLVTCISNMNVPNLINGNVLDDAKAAMVPTISCTNRGITDLTGLEAFTGANQIFLFDNCISDLSPLLNLPLNDLFVQGNKLTFEDLLLFQTALSSQSGSYDPQDDIVIPSTAQICPSQSCVTVSMGIDLGIGSNLYRLYRYNNGNPAYASQQNLTGTFSNICLPNTYVIRVTNSAFPNLTLWSTPVTVTAAPAVANPMSIAANIPPPPNEVRQCEASTFTLDITNNTTTDTFTGVQVSLTLPAGVTYVTGSANIGSTAVTEISTTPPVFGIPDILPNTTVTISYDVFVTCGTTGNNLAHVHQVDYTIGSCMETIDDVATPTYYNIETDDLRIYKVFEHLPDYLEDGDPYCLEMEVVGSSLQKTGSELTIVIDYGCGLAFNNSGLSYTDASGNTVSPSLTPVDDPATSTLTVTYALPINGDLINIAPKFIAAHCTNSCTPHPIVGFVENTVSATASITTLSSSPCGSGCAIATAPGFSRKVFHTPCPGGTGTGSCNNPPCNPCVTSPCGPCTSPPCGGCNGIYTNSHQFVRIAPTIGEADDDDDRCADGTGTATMYNVNKVMENDILEGIYEGVINLPTLSNAPFVYIYTYIDNGHLVTATEVEIEITDATGNFYTAIIPLPDPSLVTISAGPNKEIEFDISAGSPIGTLLGLPPSFTYNNNDQVIITHTYQANTNIGATTVDLTAIPLHYVGTSPNPSAAGRYLCYTDKLCNTELMGTDQTTWTNRANVTTCGEIHRCSQEHHVGRPYYEYDAFEKEYRNWWPNVMKTVTLPAGMSYVPNSAILEIHNGQNVTNNIIDPLMREIPVSPTVSGTNLIFNEPLYVSGGAPNCATVTPGGTPLAAGDDMSGDDGFLAVLEYELVQTSQLVTANFTHSFSGLGGTFTYSSTPPNNATSYSWDFDDGSPLSTQQNPAHTYTAFGTYNVCVTASNSCHSDTYCDMVQIQPRYELCIDPVLCGSTASFRVCISTPDVLPANLNGIDYCIDYDENVMSYVGMGSWTHEPPVTNCLSTGDTPNQFEIFNTSNGTLAGAVGYIGSAGTSVLCGTGKIVCHLFTLVNNPPVGQYPVIECDGDIRESYYSPLPDQYVPVQPDQLDIIQDRSFDGELIYRNHTNRPIPNDPSPSAPQTVIWEATNYPTDCNPATLPVSNTPPTVNSSGMFQMQMTNSNPNQQCGAIRIMRDIPNNNNVSSVIDAVNTYNGEDAHIAFMIGAGPGFYTPSDIYELLSADVDCDGDVAGADDANLILRRGSGNLLEFEKQLTGLPIPDWRFLNDDQLMNDPTFDLIGNGGMADYMNVPQTFLDCFPLTAGPHPTASQCTVCQAETFQGILMGDVNGNWMPSDAAIARPAVVDDIIFDLDNVTALGAGVFVVPVSYNIGGNILTSMDFLLDYNPNILTVGNITTEASIHQAPVYMSWANHGGDKTRLSSAVFDVNGLNRPDPAPIFYVTLLTNSTYIQASDLGTITGQLNGNPANIVIRQTPPMKCHIKLQLEGAFDAATGQMTNQLNGNSLFSFCDTYNRTPWHHNGASVECVSTAASNAVDWILLEARDATNNNVILETRAGILLQDGTILDIDGTSGMTFYTLSNGQSYYITARHRGHLAVMSSVAVPMSGSVLNYDFTTAATQALGTGQMMQLSNGTYALYAGDINSDGIINVHDFNLYKIQLAQVGSFYDGDLNTDGTVTVTDFNLYRPNASVIGISQIRY